MRLLALALLVGGARAEPRFPEIRGRLTSPGKPNFGGTVVWLRDGGRHPTGGFQFREAQPPAPRTWRMSQLNKDFSPRVLVLRKGDAVDFENLDAVFHNVFSLDKDNPFDLGYFKGGKHFGADMKSELPGPVSTLRPFPVEGKFRVFCNIHPDMVGTVYVFDHPFFAMGEENGLFALPVPGTGTWSLAVDGPRLERVFGAEVNFLGAPGVLEVPLKTGGVRKVAHTRKDGKAYPAKAGGY